MIKKKNSMHILSQFFTYYINFLCVLIIPKNLIAFYIIFSIFIIKKFSKNCPKCPEKMIIFENT